MRFTPDPVQFWAVVAPDRPALLRGDTTWTYRRLNEAVQESADAFDQSGMGHRQHRPALFGLLYLHIGPLRSERQRSIR